MPLFKSYLSFILFILLSLVQILQSQNIQSKKRVANDSIYISFINPYAIDIEINVTALDSTKSYCKAKGYHLLKSKDTLVNAFIIPVEKCADSLTAYPKKYIDFKATLGNPKNQPDSSLYLLPFQKGKRYKIVQSFGGQFSHNLVSSKYAIDFGTAIGDTITAARDGEVFFIKKDSKEHCRTRKCMNKANKILVLHEDGTYANYVHLDFEGALVKVGDTVKAGQAIGISGMTGFTTTPHLHFVVHKARGESILIYFKGVRHQILKKNKWYKRKI